MLELSEDQRQTLTQGKEIAISDPENHQEYVLVRADIYRRLKDLVYDDADWTPDEQVRLMADSGNRAGWDEPDMDAYDHYDENLKKVWP